MMGRECRVGGKLTKSGRINMVRELRQSRLMSLVPFPFVFQPTTQTADVMRLAYTTVV